MTLPREYYENRNRYADRFIADITAELDAQEAEDDEQH